ncbi:MAG: glycosyltransferase family 2 protein [Asticcacaulis sp.]
MQQLLSPTIAELLKLRRLEDDEARLYAPDIRVRAAPVPPGVSVVMVCYHTGSILYQSIERVLAEPAVSQLVLVDNGSSPQTSEALHELEARDERVLLVQGQGNIGFARAANLGAQLASQPWLLFLNPDAILCDGAVEGMVRTAAKATHPCLVGARVLNTDLTEQRGARRGEVTPFTTLVSLTRLSRVVPALKKFEIHLEDQPVPEAPVPVKTVSGACFLMSRADFLRMEGFDTSFFLHVEDVDLCWRVREQGGEVLFHPHAHVIHEGHTSRVEPIFVELNKGHGLNYYFRKRAKGLWRKAYVAVLGPVILGVSVLRAVARPRLKEDEDAPAEPVFK